MENLADHAILGALASVCTVLLGGVGVALNAVSNENKRSAARLDRRDEDVKKLSDALVLSAKDAGLVAHLQNDIKDLEANIDDLEKALGEAINASKVETLQRKALEQQLMDALKREEDLRALLFSPEPPPTASDS